VKCLPKIGASKLEGRNDAEEGVHGATDPVRACRAQSRSEKYYHGFREENMLGMFINLFCALSYYAKILESMTEEGAGFAPLTSIRYLDYCLTWCAACDTAMTCLLWPCNAHLTFCVCGSPLIVLDLLWNMDAPYKVTMALLVLTCLVVAVASAAASAPANYAWFCMGMFLFGGTYYGIIMIVRERLEFYVEMARDSNAKQSIKFLKTGCYIFFFIWVLYPIFWLLGKNGAQIMSDELDHVISAVMDVIAKSAYGFALLYFRLYFDKKLIQAGVDAEDFHQFSKEAIQKVRDNKKAARDPYGSSYGDGGFDRYSGGPYDSYRDEEAGYASNKHQSNMAVIRSMIPQSPRGNYNGEALQNKIRASLKGSQMGSLRQQQLSRSRPASPLQGIARDELMGRRSPSGDELPYHDTRPPATHYSRRSRDADFEKKPWRADSVDRPSPNSEKSTRRAESSRQPSSDDEIDYPPMVQAPQGSRQ